ncbi:MAG TPA: hypothetical protein VN915_12165, partial [Elusimicrobiota bacterium]|nr:hypothetical protein [Elusimicrobiota bacterium]
MNERPRSLYTRIIAALLTPAILLGSVLPAFAQVEVAAPRAIAPGAGMAVRPVPTTLGGLSAAPALSAPSALTAAPAIGAAPALSAAAAAALPALAPAAAAPAASVPADNGAPISGAAPAAAPKTILPASPSQVAQAFGAFLRGFSEVHSPIAAALGAKLFDGSASRVPQAAIDSLASEARLDVLPRRTGLPQGGIGLRKAARPAPKRPSAGEDRVQGIPLDADPASPASVEKALRALVDSAPDQFGAPSSQLAKVSVNILPAIQPGQGTSIIATFKQAITGKDDDGSPYQLAVAGKSLTFHIKVFADGKPAIMSMSGGLASGVSADVMTVGFSDDQLAAIAAKRATQPADNAKARVKGGKTAPERAGPWRLAAASKKASPKSKTGKKGKTAPKSKSQPRSGKSKPRNGGDQAAAASSDEEPAPDAPKFLTRQLTDELDGKWRAINLYQAKDPQGEPVIVIVDVKTGEAFALSAKDLHTGDEAASNKMNLISGTVSGRATLPTADGGDHGEIGPIALPLTNIYDESGKVAAVTDEKGNFTIPDDGSGKPMKLTVRLAGPLVPFVKDENIKKNGPVEVTVTANPGEKLTIMLDPVSADPEVSANIVGYVGYLNHLIWLKGLPGMDSRMDV